jgi:DNA-binding NtrC family response regulator
MNDVKDILVIDDDPDIAEYCRTVLEGHGYRVRGAISAEEGTAALRAGRPDLVILDVMMESPDSGFLLANTIAQDFAGLPVILFSSIANASMQLFDTSALPVAAIIEKPVEPADLLATVQRILKETP